VLGHPAEDRGCFAENRECLNGFNFLNVVKGKDLEALNGAGLIGLAPIPSKKKELEDAFNHGIPGFVSQLKHHKEFTEARGAQFSIYLSNDHESPGALQFGGYDLEQFAATGATENSMMWADIGHNEAYWTMNSQDTKLGGSDIAAGNQMVILDNGMSLAMAPMDSFEKLILALNADHGV
jgi:hypothetical protein